MAALHPTAQKILDWDGRHLVVTTVTRSSASTDTVTIPPGAGNAAQITSLRDSTTDTALTIDSVAAVSSTDGRQGWTVTVSAGTTGATYHILSVHDGNPAGI